MATTTDTTIASATIATNTLAIAVTPYKRAQRAFCALPVSYTTHAQKCNVRRSRAFQGYMNKYTENSEYSEYLCKIYYGAHTVTDMQYIGSTFRAVKL